jgi:hypothetical protein
MKSGQTNGDSAAETSSRVKETNFVALGEQHRAKILGTNFWGRRQYRHHIALSDNLYRLVTYASVNGAKVSIYALCPSV